MICAVVPVGRLLLEPPVDPDAATARRWAEDELARPEYHTGPSLLQRLLDWVAEQIDRLQNTDLLVGPGPLLIVTAIVVAVVVVSFVVAGPVRRSRAVHGTVGGPLLDDNRTAEQIRAAAQAATTTGDLALATAEWFRALVRGLEERTLLDERPGRTADEAAVAAGFRLPALAGELAAAATAFDAVVYGHRTVGAEDEARMRALEHRVRQARPAPVGLTVEVV